MVKKKKNNKEISTLYVRFRRFLCYFFQHTITKDSSRAGVPPGISYKFRRMVNIVFQYNDFCPMGVEVVFFAASMAFSSVKKEPKKTQLDLVLCMSV